MVQMKAECVGVWVCVGVPCLGCARTQLATSALKSACWRRQASSGAACAGCVKGSAATVHASSPRVSHTK